MAYGRNLSGVYIDLPVPRGTQRLFLGSIRSGQIVWTELCFLSQTFWSLWQFHNFLGIRGTNLICWIIDFQATCDVCHYCVLLLRPQIWIDSHKAPSLARSQKLHLDCLFMHCRQEHSWELGGALTPGTFLRLEVVPLATCLGPTTWKWILVTAVHLAYVDGGTAGKCEISEDTDWEFQDLVRLEVQWASFGKAGS